MTASEPTEYEAELGRLTTTTQQRMAQLWAAVEAGDLALGEFTELGSLLLAQANVTARGAADLILRGYVESESGHAAPVRVSRLPDATQETHRLSYALHSITGDTEAAPEARLQRIARAEPLQAAADATAAGIVAEPRFTGWTRRMESTACQLCHYWYQDGRVWQADTPMQTHTGDACQQEPVVRAGRHNVQTRNQSREAARKRDDRARV